MITGFGAFYNVVSYYITKSNVSNEATTIDFPFFPFHRTFDIQPCKHDNQSNGEQLFKNDQVTLSKGTLG